MRTLFLPPWARPLLTLLAALPLLFGTACSDDDDDDVQPTGPGNIVQVASANPDFSILVAAVTKANLATTLSGTGPFTVLAPTNAAFAQLQPPFNTAANIAAITDANQIAALAGILQYHVLSGTKRAADFPTGASAQTTVRPASAGGVNDNTVYVSKSSAGVFINGTTQVTTADVAASNGVIHAINRVLMPPMGTVAAAAIATPSLSILVQALQRPAAAALLTAAANPAANVTVFAPTNAAFQALLTQLNLTSLAQIPDNTLLAVLSGHVVNGTRAFSTDLTNNQVVTTLGAPVTVGVTGTGVTLRAPGNGTNTANVTTANILTTNGVVHIIDRVLLPQ